MAAFQKVLDLDSPVTLPMLTTFLALVMMFVMPYALVSPLTSPLLMLLKRVMFTPLPSVSFTQNMPHAYPSRAETTPLFSLLTTTNKRIGACESDDEEPPIKPPTMVVPVTEPLLEQPETDTSILESAYISPISPPILFSPLTVPLFMLFDMDIIISGLFSMTPMNPPSLSLP